MDRESFLKHKPYAGPAKPSMLRRRIGHDYASRCIYLVTMATEGRRPLLGTLVGSADAPEGSPNAPHVVLSPLGERVRQVWMDNEKHYQGVSILATMVMPDHLHGIIFIREEGKVNLGTIIKGFKAGCNKAYREILPPQGGSIEKQPPRGGGIGDGGGMEKQKGAASVYGDTACQHHSTTAKRDRDHGLLWAPKYNDHILEGAGELQRWHDYLRDNPRRLAIRRAYHEYFRVRFNLSVAGRTYAAIGNRFLLDYPRKKQVQC
jgi:REP element-mobilizing transposase RayT